MIQIAIVGRANVGKSTLFNKLTQSNYALVDDYPGLTRDRQSVAVSYPVKNLYCVHDTAGVDDSNASYHPHIKKQFSQTLDLADVIFFVVDKVGLTIYDQQMAEALYQTHKPVYLLVNKIDDGDFTKASFAFELGFDCFAISAQNGFGIKQLFQHLKQQKLST